MSQFTRLGEHVADYRTAASAMLPAQLQPGGPGSLLKKNIKSCIWEHTRDFHGGVVGVEDGDYDYKVELTGTFSKCLQRQVDEDIRMQQYEAKKKQFY